MSRKRHTPEETFSMMKKLGEYGAWTRLLEESLAEGKIAEAEFMQRYGDILKATAKLLQDW